MQNHFYKQLMESANIGYAQHKVIRNEASEVIDFIFEEVGSIFEKIIGKEAKDIVGKKVSELQSELTSLDAWMSNYSQLLREKSASLEVYSKNTDCWFELNINQPTEEYCILIMTDVSEAKASNDRVNLQRHATAELLLHEAISTGDMDTAKNFMTKLLAETIGTERASLWLISDDQSEMRCISLYEVSEQKHSEGTVLYKKDFPNYFNAMCNDTRIYAENAQTDPRTNEFTEIYLKILGIGAMLDAGIMINGKVVGVVCLEHVGGSRKWQIDEESFASTTAAVFSQIMVNMERFKTENELQESLKRMEIMIAQQQEEQELRRQQELMLMELSTPVTQLWDGILLLPLVGIIDSKRAQDVMTTMLERISSSLSKVFILDISGVAVVDTAVANYLIKMTKAAKLMGCLCIISGIAGSVAQTIVELGINIDEIQTTGSMQDALKTALKITGTNI